MLIKSIDLDKEYFKESNILVYNLEIILENNDVHTLGIMTKGSDISVEELAEQLRKFADELEEP